MRGRTMWVIPYRCPAGSSMSRVGIEVTDSPYVVASMRIMTRMGRPALDQLGGGDEFVPGLHSTGDLSPDRRFIVHYPEEKLIWSVGSGYGGNALLGKKCHALRLGSWQARQEGWLAEHMLILGAVRPGRPRKLSGRALPSAAARQPGPDGLALRGNGLRGRGRSGTTSLAAAGPGRPLWASPRGGVLRVVTGTGRRTTPTPWAHRPDRSHERAVTPTGSVVGRQERARGDMPRLAGEAWDARAGPTMPLRSRRPRASAPPAHQAREDRMGVPLWPHLRGRPARWPRL